jgi:dienelactone hydrolase
MARVLLLHSVLGLRAVERDLRARWEAAGHEVALPDLYGGRTAERYDTGFALLEEVGLGTVRARAWEARGALEGLVVLAGISMGAGLAAELVDAAPRPAGVLMLMGAAPLGVPDVSVEAHVARPDPFDDETTLSGWREATGWPRAALRRYDGVGHFFIDRALPDHDSGAARLCLRRADAFLASI